MWVCILIWKFPSYFYFLHYHSLLKVNKLSNILSLIHCTTWPNATVFASRPVGNW